HPLICDLFTVTANSVDLALLRRVERKLHVVGDDQIEVAVAVVVEPGSAGRPASGIFDAGFVGDIREGSVAVVVEESAGRESGDVEILKAIVVEVSGGDA